VAALRGLAEAGKQSAPGPATGWVPVCGASQLGEAKVLLVSGTVPYRKAWARGFARAAGGNVAVRVQGHNAPRVAETGRTFESGRLQW